MTARRRAWLPIYAWAVGTVVSWPSHLWLQSFLTQDAGDSLASAVLANQGKIVNFDFSYPYGPLSLWLQQMAVRLIHPRTLAVVMVEVGAALALALAFAWLIGKLDLDVLPATLLALGALLVALLDWPPMYQCEAAALAWALVLLASERRAAALACCVLAVLCKPSMGYVVGLLILMETARNCRQKRESFLPQVVAAGATAALAVAAFVPVYGLHPLISMLWPGQGMSNYAATGYSFFAKTNPLLVASAGVILETPGWAWALATVVLSVRWFGLRASALDAGGVARRSAAGICALATFLFVVGFYGPAPSYMYYITLPLIGLALMPSGGWGGRAATAIAVLTLVGTLSLVRLNVHRWMEARPVAAANGLWATPSLASQWAQVQSLAARQAVLFVSSGSPEASIPGLGGVWHGELTGGMVAPGELRQLHQRLSESKCVAIAPGWRLSEVDTALAGARIRRPLRSGTLFDLYGCL